MMVVVSHGLTNRSWPYATRAWPLACVVVVAYIALSTAPASAQSDCKAPDDQSWLDAEIYAWEQMCKGEWADFNRGGPPLDPSQDDGWFEERVIRSEFIEWMVSKDPADLGAINRYGIQLMGAWLREPVDISEAVLPFSFRCQGCRIAELNAERAAIGGSLDLRVTTIERDLHLLRTEVDGQLLLNDGSEVRGTLRAGSATVAGDVFLDDSRYADVRLQHAKIDGQLSARNVEQHSGAFIGNGMSVGNGAHLRASRFRDIRLDRARIGGILDASEVVVSGVLNAERLTVETDVLFADGAELEEVVLAGANIGGLLLLYDLEWNGKAYIGLREARAGGVASDGRKSSWPKMVGLDGFTFTRWASPPPAELGVAWFDDVLLDRLDTFSPGPYRELAAVMDAQGHPTIASDVRYSLAHTERLQVPWSRPDRWGRELHRAVLGYGHRPWWALGWLLLFWLIGFLLLWIRLEPVTHRIHRIDDDGPSPYRWRLDQWTTHLAEARYVIPVKSARWSAAEAAILSLDRVLPAISLVDKTKPVMLSRTQEAWLRMAQVAGWALTLFIVGWLGGLLVSQ